MLNGFRDVIFQILITQEPDGCARHQPFRVDQHVGLHRIRHFVVESFDRLPEGDKVEYFARQQIGPHHIWGPGAGFFLHAMDIRAAHPVDHLVGHMRRDNFMLERVTLHLLAIALAKRRGKVAHQRSGNVRIIRHSGGEQLVVEHDLAVGEQHRALRRSEAGLRRLARSQLLVGRQKFDCAVELADLFQVFDEADLGIQRHPFAHAQRLRLEIIVAQNQHTDFVGHFREQLVALFAAHSSFGDHRIEQYLDVDLVVRAVDAGGIVNRVGVDLAAVQRVFDAPELGETEISSFGNHLATKFLRRSP